MSRDGAAGSHEVAAGTKERWPRSMAQQSPLPDQLFLQQRGEAPGGWASGFEAAQVPQLSRWAVFDVCG